jgi:hypothetical protein
MSQNVNIFVKNTFLANWYYLLEVYILCCYFYITAAVQHQAIKLTENYNQRCCIEIISECILSYVQYFQGRKTSLVLRVPEAL